jgi:hypothetical protein
MAPLTDRDSVNALIEAHLERNSGLAPAAHTAVDAAHA